ncbi:MAG: pyruvate dehydrogenase (acetyl-transferring) E1 component subunit alpha [Deltaproteobacteria bacterium]|nr:pyruvate dehydrogenase (acetyl-transferring) E1 component subunit alpha [Deltaproteobacteria bacterium]
MLLLRRFEERAGQQYGLGKIGGFCHLYIGQEAVAVGALTALRKDDHALSGYREHGHALARGTDPGAVMAELFGKSNGTTLGKGGSMHIFDSERGFHGGYGIVGGQIPLGAGMAWATKLKGQDSVTVCFFGDAAINQGVWHEVANMAELWGLPVIFVCENNKYGMGTEVSRAAAVPDVYKRASAYDMHGEKVDGMDVLAVRDAMDRLVLRARTTMKPALLEAACYRYRGHSMADPATYRTKEELEEYKKKDPIERLKTSMTAAGQLDEAAVKALEAKIKAQVDAAVKFAEGGTAPELHERFTHVYAGIEQYQGEGLKLDDFIDPHHVHIPTGKAPPTAGEA